MSKKLPKKSTKKIKKDLTPKQKSFVQNYIIDFNATRAAKAAGYSAKTATEQGSRLLTYANIQAAIQKAIDKRAEKTGITAERVIQELALIAFADIKDYATIEDGGGVTVKKFEDMPDGASKAISRLKERRRLLSDAEGNGDNVVIDSQIELAHWDKPKALELLGKHLGIFPDKLKVDGQVINTVVTYELPDNARD